jgi:tetratricopeptide (TPR) repeat protein
VDESAAAHYHGNLGNALLNRQQFFEAAACYQRAIDLRPDLSDLHSNLGYALSKLGRLDEAATSLGMAVQLNPNNPKAHYNLGEAFAQQGRLDEAATCYRAVITLQPDIAEAHNNLGFILGEQGRLEEAIDCLHKAIAIRPDFSQAYANLGLVLYKQQMLDEAVACCRTAIALRPNGAVAHNNLGVVLEQQGLVAAAGDSYRRAIELEPDSAETHLNLAMTLLTLGDMAAGWTEYEWRLQTPAAIGQHYDFAQPRWQGEPPDGRTLLIHAEQGFGDTLQFCRYGRLATERGFRVVMQVPKTLVRLLQSLQGVDLVVTEDEAPPAFDVQIPMMSMPLALASTLPGIPAGAPYLRADEAQVADWRARLGVRVGQGLRVGVAWAGNPRAHSPNLATFDRRRSIPPEHLTPLFDLRNAAFYSLQKTAPFAPAGFPLHDFMDEMADFADTAALIANLDLVISVDTAVAHLAAALGKPVWLLNRFDTCWRWLLGRRDSAWYPTMRIYRQSHPGAWDAVLTEVVRDLHLLADARQHSEKATG